MVSIMEIMQLCRLCLVKEQVNIPIFEEQDDVRQICLKITSCLPVKITKEDKLPKKICDGCLYKLELLYQFYNTTANAEKQLLTWIEQINMDANEKNLENLAAQSTPPTVKQEKLEPVESTNENPDMSAEAQNYMLDQETFQPDFTFKESQGSTADAVDAAENSDEPLAKRPRRGRPRQATKPIPPESLDSSDNDNDNDDAGDSMLEMTVTKTEEESESEGEENVDDPEPTKFEAVGEDTEQPGPSGLGKGGADGPYISVKIEETEILEVEDNSSARENEGQARKVFPCRRCDAIFNSKADYRSHNDSVHNYYANNSETRYTCTLCLMEFLWYQDLEDHTKTHEESKFICTTCAQIFDTGYKYSMHLYGHDSSKGYPCPICTYTTTNMSSISKHINKHFMRFEYVCKHCGLRCSSKFNLSEHEEIHLDRSGEFVCVVCNKVFSDNDKLIMHQLRYHKASVMYAKNKKVCKICGTSVLSHHYLELHMKDVHGKDSVVEEADKKRACPICGKYYIMLKQHMGTHEKYKPYKCGRCEKSFTRGEYLTRHEKTHAEPRTKRYTCKTCGKSFRRQRMISLHKCIRAREIISK